VEAPGASSVWTNAALVGAGGFLGALLRYGLIGLVDRLLPITAFPYGTLAVNVLGCLAIGVLAGLAEARHLFGAEVRLFAMVGLLGGFTTFSSLGLEVFGMFRGGEAYGALANVAAHLALGLPAVWLGFALASAR
jgi:CrcB protein